MIGTVKKQEEKEGDELSKKKKKVCHLATEIIPNFWIGNYSQRLEMLDCDILVPLDYLDGAIWELGFKGEILYYPIPDYGVLPPDIAIRLAKTIVDKINYGQSVGMFCMGGHGRTGYIAAIVLGLMGIKDPIKYLREHYCPLAVETREQINQIAQILNNPSLSSHKTRIYLY